MDLSEIMPMSFEFVNACELLEWASDNSDQTQATYQITGEFNASQLQLETLSGLDSGQFFDLCGQMKWSIVLEDLSSSQEAGSIPWPPVNQKITQ